MPWERRTIRSSHPYCMVTYRPHPALSKTRTWKPSGSRFFQQHKQTSFKTLGSRHKGEWSHCTHAQGTYIVLDAPVVAALRVVQRINSSDSETRRRFRGDPNSFLVP